MKRSIALASYAFVIVAFIIVLTDQSDFKSPNKYKESRYKIVDRKAQIDSHIKKKKLTRGDDKFKFDNPNAFTDYHWGIRTRQSESHPGYQTGDTHTELLKAKQSRFYRNLNSARVSELEWTERGPYNVPGRTRAILVLPNDPTKNSWLAGSVGGGIWKTIDAGSSWVLKTPKIPSLAITWFTLCQSQPDIIYASTGEAIGGGRGIIGNGVLKSIDGGENWTILPSTSNRKEFSLIGRIVVDNNNPDVLLLCTSEGEWDREFRSEIYKSTDGGASWSQTYISDSWISQIIADPDNFNTIYAAKWAYGVLKSTDGGDTWTESSNGINKVYGRLEIAIAPSDPSRLYASAQGDISGSGADLYVSFDAGANWSFVDQKFNDQRIEFFREQGDYDNTIAVNPFDENEVYYGGVNLWKTTINNKQEEANLPVISVSVAKDSMSYWDFVNFGGEYFNGKLEKGSNLSDAEFADVEVRTGPGKSQFAHRFTVNKQGSGVPDTSYSYMDYVEIPLEVWDIDNSRQLMVSFRDQQEDGAFNLIPQNTESGDEANHSREYIYIHAVEYNTNPNIEIAQRGGENKGHKYEQMYFYWPVLRKDHEWDAENLLPDTITIDFDIVNLIKRFGEMTPVSDAYGDYIEDLNAAYDQNNNGFTFHPDHHNLVMIPVNIRDRTFKILNSNDGGVFISNISETPGVNNGDWTSKGNGYNTGQFYSVAKKPGEEVYMGGLQDNGTWKSPDGIEAIATVEYESVWGGDGFDVLWNYIDPNQYIISIYNNTFYRTENNGKTWFKADEGIHGIKPFFSKLATSNSTPDVIYTVSSLGVYKSVDFGKKWLLTGIDDQWGFSNFIDIKVSLSNPEIIWAGNGMADDMNVQVSTDGGETFTKTNNFTVSELGFLSGLATHPEDDSTAFVLFSFSKGPKILRTKDLGQTWEDISGFLTEKSSNNGFPDVAVYSLLVRPDNPEMIWAGTEIGIFESLDDGITWSFLENDMGAAAVWDMNVMDDKIVIATHGRGIFTATLPEPVDVVLNPLITGYGTALNGNLAIEVELRSLYDSTVVDINGTSELVFDNPIGLLKMEISGLPANDSLGVSVTSYKRGKAYSANPFSVMLFEVNEPVREYAQNFNDGTDDFVGDLFLITKFNGFDDIAIHTRHPYQEGVNFPGDSIDYIYQLRTPIIVASDNATLKYEDIALVEAGEIGAVYPSDDFYDYVVVEGSDDGVNWKALATGYDANKNTKWLNAYNQEMNVDKSLFIEQTINLLDTFQANDTIFIRFRLHSDPLTTGWGWAIDNLIIQSIVTGLEDQNSLVQKIKIYPNPATEYVRISNVIGNGKFKLLLFSVNGAIVINEYVSPDLSQEIVVNVSNIQTGTYILRLRSSDGDFTSKIIIN